MDYHNEDIVLKFIDNNVVDFVQLSEVAKISYGLPQNCSSQGEFPVYGSGGIIRYSNQYIYDMESVLIPRKGSLDKIFYVNVPFWTIDTIFYTKIDIKLLNPKFFYYYLQTQRLEKFNLAGGVPTLTKTILDKILIPIPPLHIQALIVNIFDKFTELISVLSQELKTRKIQFEYYRDSLLSFDSINFIDNRKRVIQNNFQTFQWLKLGDIAEIGAGSSNANEEHKNGIYPFFVRSQDMRYKNSYEFDETAIITSGDGVGVGKIFHYFKGKYALHQKAYRIKITNTEINPKFIFYYMQTNFLHYINMTAVHASVKSIRKPMLEMYSIAIPTIKEQDFIVSILDPFFILINDMNEGLPAEINARLKQYEYYRHQFLNFNLNT
ncbi:MAG: restriction endonuclease subunit S [Deltaproteobacteria bacterium]|jgi:type I restriction enzyme S subunit|nr:restriction endonuclease subunit S [Deltaproteobacteria bacterium]